MQTNILLSDCLSFNKLKAYSERTLSKSEQKLIYMHISSCELCANAINGFSAIAFSSSDLAEINKKVDIKSNNTFAKSVSISQAFISIISLLSIIGVYTLSNKVAEKKEPKNNNKKMYTNTPEQQKEQLAFEKSTNLILPKKQIAREVLLKNKRYQHFAIAPIFKNMDIKEITEIQLPENTNPTKKTDPFIYDSDIVYIYDLKVINYNSLYFSSEKHNFNYTHFTPSAIENEKSITNDFSKEEQKQIAHEVLKQGLYNFNKKKFAAALSNFNLLLENNANDINAIFYAALCYKHLEKIDVSIHLLSTILKNEKNTFYYESQWHLALCYLETNNTKEAKEILEKIVIEKGFYAKKAQEQLQNSF